MRYADLILPLPLADSFTYRIPDDLEPVVVPGCRVVVLFGKKRYYTALVLRLRNEAPEGAGEL